MHSCKLKNFRKRVDSVRKINLESFAVLAIYGSGVNHFESVVFWNKIENKIYGLVSGNNLVFISRNQFFENRRNYEFLQKKVSKFHFTHSITPITVYQVITCNGVFMSKRK